MKVPQREKISFFTIYEHIPFELPSEIEGGMFKSCIQVDAAKKNHVKWTICRSFRPLSFG